MEQSEGVQWLNFSITLFKRSQDACNNKLNLLRTRLSNQGMQQSKAVDAQDFSLNQERAKEWEDLNKYLNFVGAKMEDYH